MVSRPGAQYTPYLPLSGPVFFPQFLSGMGTPIIRGSPQFLTNHPIVSGNLEESSNIIGKTTPKIEQAGQKAEETTKYSTS
jgi:hypothetical protein